jgi:hypothetical protein
MRTASTTKTYAMDDIEAGAVFGCHDRNLEDGFRVVIDVLGPTGESLSVPEYHVRIYDPRHLNGRADRLPLFAFFETYVRRLTAAERAERLDALRSGQYTL